MRIDITIAKNPTNDYPIGVRCDDETTTSPYQEVQCRSLRDAVQVANGMLTAACVMGIKMDGTWHLDERLSVSGPK